MRQLHNFTRKKIYWADKLGAISAFLCIIHCLAVPTLLAMGIGFLNNSIFAILFILIAFFSIYKATHGNFTKPNSLILWIAFVGFVTSMALEEQAEIFQYSMFVFSLLIIVCHLYNIRTCLKL